MSAHFLPPAPVAGFASTRSKAANLAARLVCILLTVLPPPHASASPATLAAWQTGVRVHPVTADIPRHTIHSYFNTSPESPDGRWTLFFASTVANGEHGEIVIHERASGQERVLVRNVSAEDAHRVACQQWVSGGKRVVFHDERNGQWVVAAVDLDTMQERVLAHGRQLCWGQPQGDVVPLYGPHWNPGPHRDLELLNVATGQIRTALKAEAVQAAFPDLIRQKFGEKPVSIFFPELSPDARRVFFKLATPAGGSMRSGKASTRLGLVCYDLQQKRFLFQRERWGHPAWHPDSRTVAETRGELIDTETGKSRRVPNWPTCHGDHPSISPDGALMATDTTLEQFGGTSKEWGVVVGDLRTGEHVILHRFDNSQGARSWRRSHPHPAWSADSQRIYFNVSSGKWTQLFVAEAGPGKEAK